MVSLVFCDILQLPHTVISNSEKLTHPNVHITAADPYQKLGWIRICSNFPGTESFLSRSGSESFLPLFGSVSKFGLDPDP